MKYCFVLIPFAQEFRAIYHNAILPAAMAAGFTCHKADAPYAPSAIVRDIVERIFEDDVIIADITGSNPNVYYELGIAHTVGNKTIIICEETGGNLPFDLAAYRIIFYRKPVDGVWNQVQEEIEVALREFPHWSAKPTNPVQDFRPVQYAVPLSEQARLDRKISELETELRGLHREKLRSIILSLPPFELRHLMKLASSDEFHYQKRRTFIEELKKLQSLGLIRGRNRTSAENIPERGDLKQHFELTDLVREIFEELSRWLSV